MAKKKSNPARDYLLTWADHFRNRYGVQYHINWQGEGALIRRLMSKLSHRDMLDLMGFAFTDHPATSYLRTQSHKLHYLQYEYDKLFVAMKNPGNYISDEELNLDVPFWEDSRLSRLWTLIIRSDLEGLKEEFKSQAPWDLLFAKVQRQDGFIPEHVQYMYDLWKANESIERTAIKHYD